MPIAVLSPAKTIDESPCDVATTSPPFAAERAELLAACAALSAVFGAAALHNYPGGHALAAPPTLLASHTAQVVALAPQFCASLSAGGAGLGAESTLVSATHAGAEMKQIAVGPLTDAPASRAATSGSSAGTSQSTSARAPSA